MATVANVTLALVKDLGQKRSLTNFLQKRSNLIMETTCQSILQNRVQKSYKTTKPSQLFQWENVVVDYLVFVVVLFCRVSIALRSPSAPDSRAL